MTKTTKILLAISLTAFAVGFTNILWGVGTPLGAVFLGLFLISKLLEKETTLFDEEQRLRITLAERNTASCACMWDRPSRNRLIPPTGSTYRDSKRQDLSRHQSEV